MNDFFHFQDEPTLPQLLTCTAPGGSTSNYDMNRLGDGGRLTYENFIYIVMTATFKDEDQVSQKLPHPHFFCRFGFLGHIHKTVFFRN